jgi:N-formylmaleamate deformylase
MQEEIMNLHYTPVNIDVQNYRPLSQLVPGHWQSGLVVLRDGVRIHYTRTGSGSKPALVLLHGVQVHRLMWLRTAQALEAEYDVIMPDARGHGGSSAMQPGITSETMADDVAGVLRALDIEQPFVIGHSMGADTAGRFAASYPTRAVVLVDPAVRSFGPPPGSTPGELPPYMQVVLNTMAALKAQTHAERLVTAQRLLPPGTNLAAMHEADYVSLVDGMAQFDMTVFGALSSIQPLFADPKVIARITAPILLLTANGMPGMTGEPDIMPFSAHWQTGHHAHFADSGHFIPFDQFERFIDVVRVFLAQ